MTPDNSDTNERSSSSGGEAADSSSGGGCGQPSQGPSPPAGGPKGRVPSIPRTPGDAGLNALVNAQNQMIRHYFELQEAERWLFRQVRSRKPDAGRKAIRQIELERQRLGRDLHTGIGQMLAATRLQLETIAALWPTPPPQVKQALDRIAELASQAADQVRAISRRLHPPEWQRLTMAEALRQLWELSGVPERMEARFEIAPDLPEPDLEAKILFYRALQESLSNIARHSQASSVEVLLQQRAGRLVMTVRDNGIGFDAPALFASPANLSAGIGLRAIREQAAAMGGEFNVRSAPDGTTLEVSIPLGESPTP